VRCAKVLKHNKRAFTDPTAPHTHRCTTGPTPASGPFGMVAMLHAPSTLCPVLLEAARVRCSCTATRHARVSLHNLHTSGPAFWPQQRGPAFWLQQCASSFCLRQEPACTLVRDGSRSQTTPASSILDEPGQTLYPDHNTHSKSTHGCHEKSPPCLVGGFR
jgi:hypothetical protein